MKASKPEPMEMGCYGIGVTRLVGAAIETLSSETHIRWPFSMAPFSVCIIPPEKRSKAFLASHHLDIIHHQLNEICELNDSILVDDRIRINPGERIRAAKRFARKINMIEFIRNSKCQLIEFIAKIMLDWEFQ